MQSLRDMASSVTIECDLIQDSEGKAIARTILGAAGYDEGAKALRPSNCFGDPEPNEERPNQCKSEPDKLIQRAKQMKLLLPDKLKKQATAVFRFQLSDGSCRDVIGNSNVVVQPTQISSFTKFERAAGLRLHHAEESVIQSATIPQLFGFDGIPGLGFKRAIALGVSQKICDAEKDPPTKVASCRTQIAGVGMQIRADQQSAIGR